MCPGCLSLQKVSITQPPRVSKISEVCRNVHKLGYRLPFMCDFRKLAKSPSNLSRCGCQLAGVSRHNLSLDCGRKKLRSRDEMIPLYFYSHYVKSLKL